MKLLEKGSVTCLVAVLVSSLFAGRVLAENAPVAFPYERHWDETGVNPGHSPIGSDGWYAEDAAFAMVTNVTYTWNEDRPPLADPPSEHLQVLQLMEGNTGITNLFTGTANNTNATVDMLVQLEPSTDEDAAIAAIEADQKTQGAFYLNTNKQIVVYASVAEDYADWNMTNAFIVLEDFVDIEEGDWARVTLDFDYHSDPVGWRFFQISVNGNVYSNLHAFADPADVEAGDPANEYGTWFACPNLAFIESKLNAAIFSGTGRLDDYLVYGDEFEMPDPDPLDQLADGTTLALGVADNVVTATAEYPSEISSELENYMTDARITSAPSFAAGTAVAIAYNGDLLATATLATDTNDVYLSELLVDGGVPQENVRTPIIGHAGRTDVWTLTVTPPENLDTTVTVQTVVSDDDFATETVLAQDVAGLVVALETEQGTPHAWYDHFGIAVDDDALAANGLMSNREAYRAGVDPTDEDSVFAIKEIVWNEVNGTWVVKFDSDHHDAGYGLPDFELQYLEDLTADPVVWSHAATVARGAGELSGAFNPEGKDVLFFRVIVPEDPE